MAEFFVPDVTEEDAKVIFVDKDMPNGARIR